MTLLCVGAIGSVLHGRVMLVVWLAALTLPEKHYNYKLPCCFAITSFVYTRTLVILYTADLTT